VTGALLMKAEHGVNVTDGQFVGLCMALEWDVQEGMEGEYLEGSSNSENFVALGTCWNSKEKQARKKDLGH
jgi:hypothetical protein